ncbi:ABC transporter ATP-binding protein [Kineococcus gynurae]|uniref:ABC transporter ATP-binding protein n=1 Tax=Kineococcus gynurae TaxID=452979 RepID=A0ABV5LVD8_9ACTN
MSALVEVSGFTVTHASAAGPVPILSAVDLTVAAGESVAVIGESGSGKSTLALALAGFLRPGLRVHSGSVRVGGTDVFAATDAERRRLRRNRISVVPQNAGAALTPTLRIGAQLAEALSDPVRPRDPKVRSEAVRLLGQVRLPRPEEIVDRYPHELSGGQQQRVGIALALAGRPDLVILDEPTTGLDVVTQAAILDLLAQLRSELGFASLLVSHDLGVVAATTDRTSVLHQGRVLESGPTEEVLRTPAHPYTRALLSAIPRLHRPGLPVGLPGAVEAPAALAPGADAAPAMTVGELADYDALAEESRAGFRPAGTFTEFGATVLEVEDLEIDHRPRTRRHGTGPTVAGVSFRIRQGEIVALVGESGSGKSSIASAVAGLVPPSAGRITMHASDGTSEDLLVGVRRRSRGLRRRVQMVFQNADTTLNPRRTVADAVDRPLRLFGALRGAALRQERQRLLTGVGLRAGLADRLPGQLSGGQRQRVGIARALAPDPELVLADEVVSALDVSVQASVLRLVDDTRRDQRLAYLFIGHDLAVVRGLADRVIVLDKGRVVEDGPVEAVFGGRNHPVTAALLAAVLEPDPDHAGPSDPEAVTFTLPEGLEFAVIGDDRVDHGEEVWVEPAPGHRLRCRRVEARRPSTTTV